MSLEPSQVTGVQVVGAGGSAFTQDALRRRGLHADVFGGSPLQAGGAGHCTLVCAGAHQVPFQYWEAGRTTEPPRPKAGAGLNSNVLNDEGEYWYDGTEVDPDTGNPYASNHGSEPGHLWPFMSPGPLQERQDPGTPGVGTNEYWPACILNQGINHYRRGWPFRKWMFGRRGGRFVVQLRGNVVVEATNPTREYAIELALFPALATRWNAGRGGTTNTTGGIRPTQSIVFRSPDFTYNGCGGNGSDPVSLLFSVEIIGAAVYRGISFWEARFTLGANGTSAPVFDERRLAFLSTTQVQFDTQDGNFGFGFKVDGKSETTQLVTLTGTTGTFSVGQVVTKGGTSGTIQAINDDGQLLVTRVNNASFGSSGTLTGPTGSGTITASAPAYQSPGSVNSCAWTATPGVNDYPPNIVQDGSEVVVQADHFSVDFYAGT